MSGKVLVRTLNLTKRFGCLTALAEVNLQVPKGQVVGLIGPNGSGKSTLLKLLAGLLRPDSGQVFIAGKPLDLRIRQTIAFQPEVDYIYPWMTVGRCIRFMAALYPNWRSDRVAPLLQALKLDTTPRVDELSKGMRVRLKLLVTLARDARLILLDEPLAGIDPPSRAHIVESLASEYQAGEQTIILSTHEVAEVEGVLDRVILLERGRVRLDTTAGKRPSQNRLLLSKLLEEMGE